MARAHNYHGPEDGAPTQTSPPFGFPGWTGGHYSPNLTCPRRSVNGGRVDKRAVRRTTPCMGSRRTCPATTVGSTNADVCAPVFVPWRDQCSVSCGSWDISYVGSVRDWACFRPCMTGIAEGCGECPSIAPATTRRLMCRVAKKKRGPIVKNNTHTCGHLSNGFRGQSALHPTSAFLVLRCPVTLSGSSIVNATPLEQVALRPWHKLSLCVVRVCY